MLRAVVLAAAVLGFVSAGCDETEPQVDLTPAAEAIEPFPGASLHSEGVPPSGLRTGRPEDYTYDRLYAIIGSRRELTQDEILGYFRERLPESGWQVEDTIGEPRAKAFTDYCAISGLIKCASFVRGNVRAIISVPVPLSFNPQSSGGQAYHVHVELYTPS